MTKLLFERECQKIADETCRKYKVPTVPVVFSNRLKSANGTYYYKYRPYLYKRAVTVEQITEATYNNKITIANLCYDLCGQEETKATLMHELAHHIRTMLHKDVEHSFGFKKLCVELGGSMNPVLAGRTFAASATTNYVTKHIGIKYECTCGQYGHGRMEYVREPRKASLTKFRCPSCRTPMKNWKRTEK